MSKQVVVTSGRATSDWASVFLGFDSWRSMRLLRRIGPVVQGICLDRSTSGDEYFPTSHVHALTRDFPVISLALGQRLVTSSGRPESISFSRHVDEFAEAANRLRSQSILSLGEAPSLEDIVERYYSIATLQGESGLPPAVREMEDGILISAAAGKGDLVSEGLRLADELASTWPQSRLPLDWPGKTVWLDDLSRKAKNPELLSTMVEDQVTRHKLAKIRTM